MTPSETRVVFMGSPAFAVPSLSALAGAGYQVVAVVCQPDRPAGRGGKLAPPAVKVAAQGLGLEVVQPETLRDEAVRAVLDAYRADVIVVAAYGKILPKSVLAMPRRGCINVHASLLPRWRGASPINAAILAGDAETGVSIMELEPKMDTGPVILCRSMPIEASDTTASLEPRLADLGARALLDALPGWLGSELHAQPQDDSKATYCSLLTKEDGHLSTTMTAAEAERAVRAFNPWPGAFVLVGQERLAIWGAEVLTTSDEIRRRSAVRPQSLPGDRIPRRCAGAHRGTAAGFTAR